jgi:hypothetical protein
MARPLERLQGLLRSVHLAKLTLCHKLVVAIQSSETLPEPHVEELGDEGERFLLDPSSLVSVVVGGLGGFHETEQRFLVVSESFGVLGCCPDLEGKSWV